MARTPSQLPRIGIPYRTRKEELSGDFDKIEKYIYAVRRAGAEAIVLSLGLSGPHLENIAKTLDGILLTGSPADVLPARFGAEQHAETAPADPDRERTDFALLDHAFKQKKPVLAICYGIQSLNVYLGGTLMQDIPSELGADIRHDQITDDERVPDIFHSVEIVPDSLLESMAQSRQARVNTSHHQCIAQPGRGLRVVSRAEDGVVEAVEWHGDTNWVVGVQWHPERLVESDPLSQTLFSTLVAAARPTSTRA